MTRPLGFIIDKGLSPIDGKPYVAILTLTSSNKKTGDMAQVWILREDINPVEAIALGEDYSICGECPHRKQLDGTRSCYVNVGQAPLSVYRTYKNGGYKLLWLYSELESAVSGRRIRWGAYGDPAIINPQIVKLLNNYADGHTGYTHQWRQPFASAYRGIFQASIDSFTDFCDASIDGWKCFLVVDKDGAAKAPVGAKLCPATAENSQAQCKTCKLCDGSKADIYVEAHGSGSKYVAFV